MKKTAKITKAATSVQISGKRETAAVTVINQSKPAAGGSSRQITTEIIASRAYTLWEQAGRPQGRDVEYWLQAETQLKQGSQSFSA